MFKGIVLGLPGKDWGEGIPCPQKQKAWQNQPLFRAYCRTEHHRQIETAAQLPDALLRRQG